MKKIVLLALALGIVIGALSVATHGHLFPDIYNLPQCVREQLEAIGLDLPAWDPGPLPVSRGRFDNGTLWIR